MVKYSTHFRLYLGISMVTLWLFLFKTVLVSQAININEIMPANISSITDEDGDSPDWIELYNSSNEAISLNNYWLTDDTLEIRKWKFPDVTIDAYQHCLIFASDKNRRVFWSNVVNWGDTWKYFPGFSQPLSNWNSIDFDDNDWLSGPSGFGYGDDDDSTTVIPTLSLYARIIFSINNVQKVTGALLHIDYDDAFVAYLNGTEIARSNIEEPGYSPPYYAAADGLHEATIYRGGLPEAFLLENLEGILTEGNNVLAIQVHNAEISSSDLTLIPFFTLRFSNSPEQLLTPPDILQLPPISLHTNFKIKSSGETLILSDQEGNKVDSLFSGNIPVDISKGRYPDGGSTWMFFTEPTPGSDNITLGYEEGSSSEEPQFSSSGGFYSDPVRLFLTTDSPLATIYYTLDGSDPNDSSDHYLEPIFLSNTTVVRAKVYESGLIPSHIKTHTYFINEETTLPVFSLSTDPSNLWDNNYGIYVAGNYLNYFQDWERPVHVEFYEPDGNLGFSIDAGMKIFGGDVTRHFPQKSLAIFARGTYGYPELNYRLFPDLPVDVFEAFVLRNSGNDWEGSLFQDALITGLMKESDIDIQAYRPSIVFINGEYWGIHNIREKINEHYLEAHHAVNPDSIDLLENKETPHPLVIHGDDNHYQELIEFIELNPPWIEENYEYIKSHMDIDNFITYQIAEIYSANMDWPANNVKFWRPRTPEGKWRWILFDTDVGFGFWNYSENGHTRNHLAHATEAFQPEQWPNPPWSTFLLRHLLLNSSFRYQFINQFANRLNTTFHSERVLERIHEIKTLIEPEIPSHVERWNQDDYTWYGHIYRLETFASKRVKHVRNHITSFFGLPGTAQITFSVTPKGSGSITLNSMAIDTFPWKGVYFKNIPVTVVTKPTPGYRFVGWLGIHSAIRDTLSFNPQYDMSVTAVFELDSLFVSSIVINEINYNDAADFNTGDWIEFFNPAEEPIDISGWVFKDSDEENKYTFPENTIIDPDGYLVLCRNTVAFTQLLPEVSNYMGEFDFGLSSSGESVRLFNTEKQLIDSVSYGVEPPWPGEPNGNGPTLTLINPYADNNLPGNWTASIDHGTPGSHNGETSLVTPDKVELYQNYPNPFNTNTLINFSLLETTPILLKVYDIQGREVATLLDEIREPGIYKYFFDKQDISSGIYFYQLRAGEYIKTRRMIFIK